MPSPDPAVCQGGHSGQADGSKWAQLLANIVLTGNSGHSECLEGEQNLQVDNPTTRPTPRGLAWSNIRFIYLFIYLNICPCSFAMLINDVFVLDG